MELLARTIVGFVAGLMLGIIVLFLGATVAVWITFFFTPTLWAEWNILTLPFQYTMDWGYYNPTVQIVALIGLVIGFIFGAASID